MAAGRLLLDTTGNSQRKPFFTSLIPPPLVVCAPFVVFDVDSTLFPWCNFFYCFLFAGLRVVAVLFCFRCQGARLFCRFSFYCSESRSTRRREQARGAQITGQPTHVLPLVPRPFHKDVDRLSKVPRVRLTLLFFITLASLSLSHWPSFLFPSLHLLLCLICLLFLFSSGDVCDSFFNALHPSIPCCSLAGLPTFSLLFSVVIA